VITGFRMVRAARRLSTRGFHCTPRLLVDELREEGAIILAGQEARELSPEPVGETARELGIMTSLQTLEHKGTKQNLATGIDGAFLLGEPGLQSLLPRLELRNAFHNRPSGHGKNLPLLRRENQTPPSWRVWLKRADSPAKRDGDL
jgi:hypothetical protein